MLFECLMVFFIIDESDPYSFEIIKDLTTIIIKEKFPDLPIILLQNKKEIKKEKKIKENEMNVYLKLNPFIINFEISLNGNELLYILKEINDEIYNSKNIKIFSSNFILESKDNKIPLSNIYVIYVAWRFTSWKIFCFK